MRGGQQADVQPGRLIYEGTESKTERKGGRKREGGTERGGGNVAEGGLMDVSSRLLLFIELSTPC